MNCYNIKFSNNPSRSHLIASENISDAIKKATSDNPEFTILEITYLGEIQI